MQKIAIFPGSFDPITKGHESVVNRALPLFDKIIIAIGNNSEKNDSLFPLKSRINWIKQTFNNKPKVEVKEYDGLTIDFCKKMKAGFILRGLRTSADFEFERAIAQTNRFLAKNIETIFILTTPEHTSITSTIVREVFKNGGDTSLFVPKGIILKK
ncbi:MAG: pantetheine-phosphate adenylyltransferase [Bacteroidetes bacterium CG02_land_8_20_14_3_00_31_25]|nr:MAG: pantetheine-phosphate adenylyltransferase [Bacteroidetes bacterium CG02_land_8_20_14_3_00_31_25]